MSRPALTFAKYGERAVRSRTGWSAGRSRRKSSATARCWVLRSSADRTTSRLSSSTLRWACVNPSILLHSPT
ncbi:hypothetical protein ABH927_000860 [Planotetraspora sp. GP83]